MISENFFSKLIGSTAGAQALAVLFYLLCGKFGKDIKFAKNFFFLNLFATENNSMGETGFHYMKGGAYGTRNII